MNSWDKAWHSHFMNRPFLGKSANFSIFSMTGFKYSDVLEYHYLKKNLYPIFFSIDHIVTFTTIYKKNKNKTKASHWMTKINRYLLLLLI